MTPNNETLLDASTLDGLIAALQAVRDAGIPGDTPIFTRNPDAVGPVYACRVHAIHATAVAKSDFSKGWAVCRTVASRGVAGLLVG